ncbi:hypothetical protein [Streptomyces chryseus]|uniref:hypothetical protein n=1 Tax=Streptomyces chryseus TaxID=68186 RepID=UPI00110FE9E5|nr:hypothetical protein [Streptomyces chryseus]GGX02224.1 hypothetical protein GCM10010353_17410 [Streptomyces chryseus]
MTGPEHYRREAERLAKQANHYTYGDGADPVTGHALAAEAQVYATLALVAAQAPAAPAVQLETEPAVAYVYRAAWGMTPLGTYTNSDAARAHCQADALNNSPEYEGGIFEWLGDESEPDDPYELLIAKNGADTTTDYTVTRIEVATEYDPEADS